MPMCLPELQIPPFPKGQYQGLSGITNAAQPGAGAARRFR